MSYDNWKTRDDLCLDRDAEWDREYQRVYILCLDSGESEECAHQHATEAARQK